MAVLVVTSGDRRVDVGSSLDRFNDGNFLFGSVMGADFRQFDKNKITQRFLRMVGNTDRDRTIGVLENPLVGGSVLQVSGDVGHGFLLNGGELDDSFAVAGEYGFGDLGLEQFATDIDFDFIANGDAKRQAGEGDGLLECW